MTSAINPNNINGNYPVANQPNNTQGFRDNFTNTKTNFQYAADELTDLQSKAVLKAALTGSTLDNNMGNQLIYAALIQDFSATAVQITATSGSIAVDYSAGHYQTIVPTGSISISFTTNTWPAAGTAGLIRLRLIINDTACTVTLPSTVSVGTTGIQGLSANTITFGAAGTYEFDFETVDGGTTVTIFDLNRPLLAGAGSGVGFATGSGGTVTQASSRTTGVTINKKCGAITLYSAAGTSAYASFTVTNSLVTANDVIVVNQQSGTNTYLVFVTAVAAGSFRITFSAVSGTATDAPVFNFAVIEGVPS
jgi:hypothetical protein